MTLKHKKTHWFHSITERKIQATRVLTSVAHIQRIKDIQENYHSFCTRKGKVKSLSYVWLFVTPWTVAYQAPPSMGFTRQECWSGLPFPSPGDLPNPGIKSWSPVLQADALPSEPPGKPSQQEWHANSWRIFLF